MERTNPFIEWIAHGYNGDCSRSCERIQEVQEKSIVSFFSRQEEALWVFQVYEIVGIHSNGETKQKNI
jgi:hypothetical protein